MLLYVTVIFTAPEGVSMLSTRLQRRDPQPVTAMGRRLQALITMTVLLLGAVFQTVLITPAASAAAVAALPPVTQDVSPLSAFDAEILRLTNVQRAAAGLPALQEARGLDSLSTWWSKQEASGVTNGALAHNPNGYTMVLTYGASKRTFWGENVIRWSPNTATAQNIFDAYWASPTHKANLLSKSFGYVGLGTVTTSTGVSFNTMNFVDVVDAGQTFDPKAAATPVGQYESAALTGATVRLTGWAVDPDITTAASALTITDTPAGGVPVSRTATANTSRPDIGTRYPKSGNAHGFDFSYVTSGRGAHNVCVTVVNQGAGLGDVALGCISYTVGNPVGVLGTPTHKDGILTLAGWAVDPAKPTAAATVTITDKLGTSTTTTNLVANLPNAAGGTAVPGAGSNHGFAGTALIAGVGDHSICATVSGVGTPIVTTDLGCQTVRVGPATPLGAFDSATAATRDTVSIAGWGADPDFPTRSVLIKVRITNSTGTVETRDTRANQTYPVEVAPGFGVQHAFARTLPLTSDGVNTVCVSSASLTGWQYTTDLGCKDVTVNWVTGNLDKLTPTTTAAKVRTIRVEGWGLDRGALTATTPVKLEVTAPNGAVSTTTTQANTARPDVGRAIAGAGDNHGYVGTVGVSAAGTYQVCSTVLSTRTSGTFKQFTCQTVTVQ
jgi:uncharacterized protein YkwD